MDSAAGEETSGIFEARTVRDLIMRVYMATNHFKTVGLFERVSAIIDIDRASPDNNAYVVTFLAKEPKRATAKLRCLPVHEHTHKPCLFCSLVFSPAVHSFHYSCRFVLSSR